MSEQWIRQAWQQALREQAELKVQDEGHIAAAVLREGDGEDRDVGLQRLAQSPEAAAIGRVLLGLEESASELARGIDAQRPQPMSRWRRQPRWPLWGLAASLAVAVALNWPRPQTPAPAPVAVQPTADATLLQSSFEETPIAAQPDDRVFAAGFDS